MGNTRIIEPCTAKGCSTLSYARGLCQKHYTRARRANTLDRHKRNIAPKGAPLDYLLNVALKHTKKKACLIWPYGKIEGYGAIRYKGQSRIVSHIVCQLAHGKPPSKKHEARHSCGKGNEGCVNPHHLSWSTHARNMADTIKHGTSTKGEKSTRARLTESKVLRIRALRKKGWKYTELSAKFDVSYATIAYIIQRRTWSHI